MPNKIEALPSRSITTIYIVAVIAILLGLVWSYCNLFKPKQFEKTVPSQGFGNWNSVFQRREETSSLRKRFRTAPMCNADLPRCRLNLAWPTPVRWTPPRSTHGG